MKVSIVGSGYVGLVSGAGLSQVGHHVICMDRDPERIEMMRAGRAPIFEPGLEGMLQENSRQGRLQFTTSMEEAVRHAEVLLIAVGTPPLENGSADLVHVLEVARSIGSVMTKQLLVVIKSTVPVGTCDRVRQAITDQLRQRGLEVEYSVASNPEFLAEGAAVSNFMKPDRIVAGVENDWSEALLRELYAPFNRNHEKLMCMDVRSSELTKYAANAMLAARISLMNELANIAERVGADIEHVRLGIGSDPRIGYSFIYPGAGYGGSCFPKDVRALRHTASEYGYRAEMLEATESVNQRQKQKPFQMLQNHFTDGLQDLKICVWGLAFKPNTDDIREASSLVLIRALMEAGATVQAHDPEAGDSVLDMLGGHSEFSVYEDPYAAAMGCDALVLMTEWRQYWAPDFDQLCQSMQQAVVVDARNIWPPARVRERGFTYYSIGRP